MKSRNITIIFLILGCTSVKLMSQDRALYVVTTGGAVLEKRSTKIYGSGIQDATSKSVNGILAIRTVYATGDLMFGAGLSYLSRAYKMKRPFNHCYFDKPGDPCEFILAHVDKYSYETFEIPLSLDIALFRKRRLTFFVGATYINAFIIEARYHAFLPDLGVKENDGSFSIFSKSFNAQIADSFEIKDRFKFFIQPFIRIHSRQKGDGILFEPAYPWIESDFDSFGLIIELHYRLSKSKDAGGRNSP